MSDANPSLIASETCVQRKEGVVLRHVAGEHMLVPTVAREVDLDSLFLLNATGVFVWEHLDGHRSLADLGGDVARAFGISPEVAVADVTRFLMSLLERKLAERTDGNGR